jgi:hypothetical protein
LYVLEEKLEECYGEVSWDPQLQDARTEFNNILHVPVIFSCWSELVVGKHAAHSGFATRESTSIKCIGAMRIHIFPRNQRQWTLVAAFVTRTVYIKLCFVTRSVTAVWNMILLSADTNGGGIEGAVTLFLRFACSKWSSWKMTHDQRKNDDLLEWGEV